ncbi:hypothetical protein [Nocardia noduli]|uniref:hypothetical protein n=1 Tax=Nocardia noduli TaxID=2815722 RepID=UPI001C2303A3|nr:hypothetical protein [Nocardia noduli]
MAFKLYTNDTQEGRALEFGDDATFEFHGDVLVVDSHLGVRYYSPNQWQELHFQNHPGERRPKAPSEL